MGNDTNTNKQLCQCGRPLGQIHCPACGSIAYYGKPSKTRIEITAEGNPVKIKTYRCRRCGEDYDDLMRAKCEAPQFEFKSMAERRIVDETMLTLGEEMKKLKKGSPEWLDLARKMLNRTKPGVANEVPEAPLKIVDDKENKDDDNKRSS